MARIDHHLPTAADREPSTGDQQAAEDVVARILARAGSLRSTEGTALQADDDTGTDLADEEAGEPRETPGADGAGPPPAKDDEAPAPRRRPARAGAGVEGAADAAGKRGGNATRLAGKATAGRAGRSARGRQGRSDG